MSVKSSPIFYNKQHSSVFLNRLQCQREVGLFCDVVLHVGSHTYAAHKNLLAASSLYFESLFLKELSKQKEQSVHITVCTDSVSPSAFSAVLDYIYLGYIYFESISVADVMMLANEFCLDSLRDYCHVFLEYQKISYSSLHDSLNVDAATGSTTEKTNADDCVREILSSELQSENNNPEWDSKIQENDNYPHQLYMEVEEIQSVVQFRDKRVLKEQENRRVKPRKRLMGSNMTTRFSCFWCGFQCTWASQLTTHVNVSHFPEPPYTCDRCMHTASGVEELLRHRKTHLSIERQRPFECYACNKRFRINSQLTNHLISHTGEKAHVCTVCGNRYSRKATLNEHIVTHSDHQPYLCHLCGFSTHRLSSMLEHKRKHNGELFRCEVPNCGYTTTRRFYLRNHNINYHLKLRRHICSKCAKSFSTKLGMERHERSHGEIATFNCKVSDCVFSTLSMSRTELVHHMRTHPKIRQHICEKCGLACIKRSSLRTHERLHQEERPYKCDRCPYDCKLAYYLKAHKATCCSNEIPR